MASSYAAHVAAIFRRARATRRLHQDALTESVVRALGVVVERRDRNTEGHCQRLAVTAAATGAALGLSAGELRVLQRGGYLHDIGKLAIPDAILQKRGPLTPAEFDVMKLHPAIGDALCRRSPLLEQARQIVRWHHERLDGSGYPDGIRGDRIPLDAQIIAVADVYDALTSERPYKGALSPDVACELLMDEVRKGWRRRDLVEMFIKAVAEPEMRLVA